jgi:DNA invertase Pin-like site-specific DNA recombinase
MAASPCRCTAPWPSTSSISTASAPWKAALPRDRKSGRPKKLKEADLEADRAMLAAGTIGVAEIAKRLGVNSDTFYSYFPRARANSITAK